MKRREHRENAVRHGVSPTHSLDGAEDPAVDAPRSDERQPGPSELDRALRRLLGLVAVQGRNYEDLRSQMAGLSDELQSLRSLITARESGLGREIRDSVTRRHDDLRKLESTLADRENEVSALRTQVDARDCQIGQLERILNEIYVSRSWRLTAPIRKLRSRLRSRRSGEPGAHGEAVAPSEAPKSYRQWVEDYDTLQESDRQAMRREIARLEQPPRFSIIMPVFNVADRWLRMAIDSVRAQLYPDWELCIADDASSEPHVHRTLAEYESKDERIRVVYRQQQGGIAAASNSAFELATGDFVVPLDDDDELAEHALYWAAREINSRPDIDILYSDEDKIDEYGQRFDPHFKPDFNLELFLGQNYLNHLTVLRRQLVSTIGGFRNDYEGSQDYDLYLRLLDRTDRIGHIPRILYHWRAISGSAASGVDQKSYATDAARRAKQDYLVRNVLPAEVQDVGQSGYHRITWSIPQPQPKVTIVIPTHNGYRLLRDCLRSVRDKTDYPNFDVLIVDNRSTDRQTLDYLEHLSSEPGITVESYDAPFNYSAINNFAARRTDGELILFLNNDTVVLDGDWLREMVSYAARPDVGAVGAKLLYPNKTVQHGGVLLGAGIPTDAVAGHLFHGLAKDEPGYFCRAILTQELSAVTAACMLTDRRLFLDLGGFNEDELKVAFNDVDLCLRIRERGLRVIWTPNATLEHRESASRGYEDTIDKRNRFRGEIKYMRQRWGESLEQDRFYNPNLDLLNGNFSLASPPRLDIPWHNKK